MSKLAVTTVNSWISDITGKRVVIDAKNIIFNTFNINYNDKLTVDIILYLICELKFAIWNCRNEMKCNFKKDITPSYIVRFILNRIKSRILADYTRFSEDKFITYYMHFDFVCDLVRDTNRKLIVKFTA